MDREMFQNGVLVGLGPIAVEEGYKRGTHVIFRRDMATEFNFLGRKLLVLFSSGLVMEKLDELAPDYEEKI